MDSKSALVSIVIPVYNLGDYLTKTLESIAQQTYPNLEILLINDHSSDDSLLVSQQWSQQDSRFHVESFPHHQGVSRARNRGIDLAKGDYISFVDGDDLLEPAFIEGLVTAIQQPNVGLAAVGYSWGNYWQGTQKKNQQSHLLTRKQMYQVINRHGDEVGGYIWNKLFKTSVLRVQKIRFDESLKLAEDLLFTAEYVAQVPDSQFAFKPTILYHKVNRRGSIIHSATWSMREKEQSVREQIDELGEKIQ